MKRRERKDGERGRNEEEGKGGEMERKRKGEGGQEEGRGRAATLRPTPGRVLVRARITPLRLLTAD